MNELHEKISRWMVGRLLLLQARLCREKERVKEREAALNAIKLQLLKMGKA